MFKIGKAKNVIARLNNMSKKEAYTWGAVAMVCLVALLLLGSLFGDASDPSFDGMSSRGYDLAQMPFLDDEAEKYLLSSKYKDMQGAQVDALYSSEEKKARQEEDAANADKEAAAEEQPSASSGAYAGGNSSSGRVRGYRGGGASRTPTAIGQLGSPKSGGSSGGGSGLNATWGNPSGDFSPYNKSQDKGDETPLALKNTDARRALSQFAQTSRASAGLKDAKGVNAKRALMGGNIKNSEAFTESGVQMSSGLTTEDLDTNAPASSADLSGLDDAVNDANNDAQDDNKDDDHWLLETILGFVKDLAGQFSNMLSSSIGEAWAEKRQQQRALDGEKIANMAGEFGNGLVDASTGKAAPAGFSRGADNSYSYSGSDWAPVDGQPGTFRRTSPADGEPETITLGTRRDVYEQASANRGNALTRLRNGDKRTNNTICNNIEDANNEYSRGTLHNKQQAQQNNSYGNQQVYSDSGGQYIWINNQKKYLR